MSTLPEGLPPLSAETIEDYLGPWLDGVLPDDVAQDVAALVAADADLSELVSQMRMLSVDLPDAFDAVLRAPVPLASARAATGPTPVTDPAPAEDTNVVRFPQRSRWVTGGALAASLCIAVFGGMQAYQYGVATGIDRQAASEQARFGWLTQVAQMHQVFTSDTAQLVEVAADDPAQIAPWLAAQVGGDFVPPDLTSFGLSFAGARLIVVNGTPAAQVFYTGPGYAAPVAFCYLPSEKADQGLTPHERDGTTLVSWREDGFDFVVVGEESTERLTEIAAHSQIEI